jgi:hypothetical protein
LPIVETSDSALTWQRFQHPDEATYMTRLSDSQQQYDQDDFIVEISLFDEFEDDEEPELIPADNEHRVLH